MSERTWMDEPPPPRYIVGDFINLELGFEHTMHVLEAQLVFEYEEDPSITMILEGALVRRESYGSSMVSALQVSQDVQVEDVPGRYRFRYVEIVTASMRELKVGSDRIGGITRFEIIPEPDELGGNIGIIEHTRGLPYPPDEPWEGEVPS